LELPAGSGGHALGLDENIVGRYEQAAAALQLTAKLDQLREEAAQIAERLRSTESL
jgi:hypothetical protein